MLAATNPIRLDKLDLFSDCTKGQLQQISSLTSYLRLPKGHVLMHEGAPAREFIVILSGSAQVTRQTAHGVVRVADVGPGDFQGEMGLLAGSPRTATVTATSDLVVLVSSVGEFRSMLELAPSVAAKVRRASSVRASDHALAA
jgi:CRP/FNR family cyclic AMP-dependent transcriptional regulator